MIETHEPSTRASHSDLTINTNGSKVTGFFPLLYNYVFETEQKWLYNSKLFRRKTTHNDIFKK